MAANSTSFKKGESKGKPKGALNKATKTVKDAFTEAFGKLQLKKGVNLADWGKENPTEFYKLCTKLIPQAVDATVTMKKLGADLEEETYTD
jgi:hypothetical protein